MSNQGAYKEFRLIKNEKNISNDTYYMGIAHLIRNHKGGRHFYPKVPCSRTSWYNKHGACIVNPDGQLISIGVNTALLEATFKKFEISASLNSINKNSTIYLTHFPYYKDALAIKQSGITKLFYLNNCSKCKKQHTECEKNQCKKCDETISLLSSRNDGKSKFEIKKFSDEKKRKIIILDDLKEEESPFELPSSDPLIENLQDFDFWMFIAVWTAACSQDTETKVGACILDRNNKFLFCGHNGSPNDRIEECFMSELNAIINSKSNDLEGATMFVTLFSSESCAELIIASGIKQVIYLSDHKYKKDEFQNSRRLLKEHSTRNSGFVLKKISLDDEKKEFTIDFEEDN